MKFRLQTRPLVLNYQNGSRFAVMEFQTDHCKNIKQNPSIIMHEMFCQTHHQKGLHTYIIIIIKAIIIYTIHITIYKSLQSCYLVGMLQRHITFLLMVYRASVLHWNEYQSKNKQGTSTHTRIQPWGDILKDLYVKFE